MNPGARNQRGNARFISNTIALAVFAVAGTVLTLMQVKLLSGSLTRELFGLFASFRGFALLLATLSANGIPALLVRFLPVHEAGGNRRSAARLSIFSLCAVLLLLLVALTLAWLFRAQLFAFVPGAILTQRLLFWFAVMTLGITLKLVVYAGLNGLRRLVHQVVIELLSLAVLLVWIYLQRHQLTIELLFQIFGIVSMATLGISLPVWASFVRSAGESGPVKDSGDGPYRSGYLGYWYGAAGLSVIAVAFTDFDRYLLSQIIALEFLALFHIGSRIMKLANRLLGVSNLAFQPEITRLHEEGRGERIESATRVLIKFNTALSMLLLALIIGFSREMILIVATPEYLGAVPLLILLCCSLPLTTITAPVTTVMKALDQVRGALYCDLAWALAYLSLLFLLGTQFGILGVGVAHLSACLAQLLLSLHISRLRLGYRFILGLTGKLGAGVLVAFSPLLVLLLVRGTAGTTPLYYGSKVLFACAAVVVFHWIVLRISIFDADERRMLSEMFERRGLQCIGRLFA